MLRRIIYLPLCALLVLLLSTEILAQGSASQLEDACSISEEIKVQIEANPTDDVFRIYNVPITFAFAEYNNIDDILKSDLVLSVLYVKVTENNQNRFYQEEGDTLVPLEITMPVTKTIEVFKSAEAITRVAADIKIYNTFYLSGDSSRMGAVLYYKTNKGDYVYYNHYSIGERVFSVEVFCEFQKAVLADMIANGHLDGSIDTSNKWDLSAYDFNSKNFNPAAEFVAKETNSDTQIEGTPLVEKNIPTTQAKPKDDPGNGNGIVWITISVTMLVGCAVVLAIACRKRYLRKKYAAFDIEI
jgi:hypothetical protein